MDILIEVFLFFAILSIPTLIDKLPKNSHTIYPDTKDGKAKQICDENRLVIESGHGGFLVREDNSIHYKENSDTEREWSIPEYVKKLCVHHTLEGAKDWILQHYNPKKTPMPVFGKGIPLKASKTFPNKEEDYSFLFDDLEDEREIRVMESVMKRLINLNNNN